MTITRVGIVGGGPGGLMTAYLLQKLTDCPLQISLFEASPRIGGKILTQKFSSIPATYEAGAAEFYDYTPVDEDPLRQLVAELGLSVNPMGGSSVIMQNRVIANLDDIEHQFGSPARTAYTQFDDMARGSMSPREFYEADFAVPPHDSHNFQASHRTSHRFNSLLSEIPEPSTRQLIECLIHSDLATEPEKTSISYGLQNYLMNHPAYMRVYSIEGGNEQLPNELCRRTHQSLRLQHKVTRIARGNSGRLRVTSNHHDILQDEEFDVVVVALPHDALPSIEYGGWRLTEAMKRHLDQYDHQAHYLRMTLLFDHPFWRGKLIESWCMLDQFHGCCLYDESSREPEAKHGVLGWLLGGRDAEELSLLPDEELIERALLSLPDFLAEGRRYFLEGRVHRWIGAVNALPGGVVPQNPDQRHQPEPLEHSDLFVVGDYLFDSTLNGVLDSASYVAAWIAATLADRGHAESYQEEPSESGPLMTAATKSATPMTRELQTQFSLPPGAAVQQIVFTTEVLDGQTIVHELPRFVQKKAVLVRSEVASADCLTTEAQSLSSGSHRDAAHALVRDLQILVIPATSQDDPQVPATARLWVEGGGHGNHRPCLPIILQGAQIFWSPGHTAVIAPPERMETVRGAIIEFCFFEAELRCIEGEIGDRWPQLDIDTPLAFEFREQAVAGRKELMQRFQHIVSMRSRLSRIAPHIECPPIFPPTLANQVGERLREKSRLADRLQFTREQIEVFEKVYEMCGQRASDFMSSRTSHTLEWVIILLLAAETILLAVDRLSSAAGT